jgi:hypothetical protein
MTRLKGAKSGGKPTFLTFETGNSSPGLTLKGFQPRIRTQLKAAQGQEGGLAPALSSAQLLQVYQSESISVSPRPQSVCLPNSLTGIMPFPINSKQFLNKDLHARPLSSSPSPEKN